MYLDNEMNSLPSVQRSRQMKTANGCTVSMHCGPNTLGVLFCKK